MQLVSPAAKIKIQTYLPFPKLREDDSNDRNRHVRKGSSLEGQGRGKKELDLTWFEHLDPAIPETLPHY